MAVREALSAKGRLKKRGILMERRERENVGRADGKRRFGYGWRIQQGVAEKREEKNAEFVNAVRGKEAYLRVLLDELLVQLAAMVTERKRERIYLKREKRMRGALVTERRMREGRYLKREGRGKEFVKIVFWERGKI